MADTDESPENLQKKLTTITKDLECAIKTIDKYSERQQIAERNRKELEDSEKNILVLQKQLNDTEATCKRHQIETHALQKNMEHIIKQREAIIREQKQKIQRNERFIKERDLKISELEDIIEHSRLKTTDKTATQGAQLRDDQDIIERPMQQNTQTHNTLSAAELSDANRPTRLAERFTELYDNQWREAFDQMQEEMKSDNKKNMIEVLLLILLDTIKFCEEEANIQTTEIQKMITQKCLTSSNIPDVVNKYIKGFQRNIAEFSGEQLYKKFQKNLNRSRSSTASVARRIPYYIEECFKICWLLTVNDPPVVFGHNVSIGETFNTDMYKAYTNNGSKVDFVVWPALLLHQNGPVICKGVAQALGDTPRVQSAPKSRIQADFGGITSENEKSLPSPNCLVKKQDLFAQTTVATKTMTQKVPSRYDIEMFIEWRERFGKERARKIMGAERYDNICNYCIGNLLI